MARLRLLTFAAGAGTFSIASISISVSRYLRFKYLVVSTATQQERWDFLELELFTLEGCSCPSCRALPAILDWTNNLTTCEALLTLSLSNKDYKEDNPSSRLLTERTWLPHRRLPYLPSVRYVVEQSYGTAGYGTVSYRTVHPYSTVRLVVYRLRITVYSTVYGSTVRYRTVPYRLP